jgi:transketolase C-terminal domain/subunit
MLSEAARMYKNVEAINYIGVPNSFIDKYGSQAEIDKYLGLDDDSIYEKLKEIYGETNV